MNKGIGGHHRGFEGAKDEWLTPPGIIKSLGTFDLDPCSPVNRPWDTATKHYTTEDDGLLQPWEVRVFLNPPYGPHTFTWMEKLYKHGNGIALIFARTETEIFFKTVWGKATSMLFLNGRLYFYDVKGVRASNNSGAPSVLIAYGENNAEILKNSKIPGFYV